jgi:dipeptidyl aminopeptidase/acylaminoacyl peptidase
MRKNKCNLPYLINAFKVLKEAIACIIFLVYLNTNVSSQVSISDYSRADSTEKFNDLVYHGFISPKWIENSNLSWYCVKTRKGQEYFIVDAKKKIKTNAFDQEKLTKLINQKLHKDYKPYSLILEIVSLEKNLKEITFIIDSCKLKYNMSNNQLQNLGKIPTEKSNYWSENVDELSNPPVISPDSSKVALIKNYNVYVKDKKSGEEFQLSFDGSEGEFYSSFMEWSPDSKHLACNKIRDNKKHFIYFVESSPISQLQPILHKREYLKPGDALPIKQPSLFNISKKKQITIDTKTFEFQYDITNIKWRKNSQAFTFEFNQRGHQVYQVVSVEAATGSTKILVNETSPTFVEYSGKLFRYDVNDSSEIIWASERDGWNHLYLIDAQTSKIKKQITQGEWVVRGVEHVDEGSGTIIFKGSGRNPGEDPYFIHYYRINFDGTGLTDLTPEPANHEAYFSKDFNYFIDNYSKIDQPPISFLKDKSGNLLMQIEKADISDLQKKNYRMPEPFVTKGRDGKTNIWGNIYRPTNFDPAKSYPIIEYIYAGPQSSFVLKSFRPYISPFSGLAELGFIVVQIDGMGTSNRSKAFHDVCFKNLKDAGFPDRMIWIKAAAEKYHYMDTSRIGIFGGSAGGQNALAGLLFHPEFYKAGVSSCGCHDNRMDKMWWNEQWMGYPIGPQYEECSNVVNAKKLKGELLLIVGEIDDNVDPASTMQVANALIKAGKNFDLLVIPGSNHTLGGKYGERKRRDFFVQHLLKQQPPVWNQLIYNKN